MLHHLKNGLVENLVLHISTNLERVIHSLKGRQRLNKFDAKAIPGVFIGYSEVPKAFRIWVPSKRKVVTKYVNIMQKPYYEKKRRKRESY